MDSMRSLNTSLPTSTTYRRRGQPPEQLLQAFRTAALSVTNLYKTAATEQGNFRQQGYQEALDDLLAFLDKENLGLGDGEGWKVRRWATERLDGSGVGTAVSESEDDRGDGEKNVRNSSPVAQRRPSEEVLGRQISRSASPIRTGSAPPTVHLPTSNESATQTPPVFTFTSTQTLPQQHEIEMQSAETMEATNNEQAETTVPVRVEMVPRGLRTPHRHGSASSRHNMRSSTRDLGAGTGSKRKIQFDNFFDISNLGNGKDGFGGGGKRGRFA
jgi:hypothetical protein